MYDCVARTENQKTQRSLSTETLVLVRSRGHLAHLWIPRRVLERSWVSVELQAPALFPRSVATTTCTHVSSYATLVCAFFVLELETNFLSISFKGELVSVLLDQVFETGSFAFRTTACRFAFATSALRSFLL